MSEPTLESLGLDLMKQKRIVKEATDRIKKIEKVLGSRMEHGQEVQIAGKRYRWTVSISSTVKYKEALSWLYSRVGPDVQVLIEESKASPEATGSRTTKGLKEVGE